MRPTLGRVLRTIARGWRHRKIEVETGDTGARATIWLPVLRVGGYRVRVVLGWEALAEGQDHVGDYRFPQ